MMCIFSLLPQLGAGLVHLDLTSKAVEYAQSMTAGRANASLKCLHTGTFVTVFVKRFFFNHVHMYSHMHYYTNVHTLAHKRAHAEAHKHAIHMHAHAHAYSRLRTYSHLHTHTSKYCKVCCFIPSLTWWML